MNTNPKARNPNMPGEEKQSDKWDVRHRTLINDPDNLWSLIWTLVSVSMHTEEETGKGKNANLCLSFKYSALFPSLWI